MPSTEENKDGDWQALDRDTQDLCEAFHKNVDEPQERNRAQINLQKFLATVITTRDFVITGKGITIHNALSKLQIRSDSVRVHYDSESATQVVTSHDLNGLKTMSLLAPAAPAALETANILLQVIEEDQLVLLDLHKMRGIRAPEWQCATCPVCGLEPFVSKPKVGKPLMIGQRIIYPCLDNPGSSYNVIAYRTGNFVDLRRRFLREIGFFLRLQHDNIVKITRVVSEARELGFLSDWNGESSLWDLLHRSEIRLSYKERVQIALQICEGLIYLHEKGGVHRDIYSANVLLSRQDEQKWTVTLRGFGLARPLQSSSDPPHINLRFQAPETLTNFEFLPQADVYAFGCLLIELFASKTQYVSPWMDSSDTMVLDQLSKSFVPPESTQISEGLIREICQTCLCHNPLERLSPQRIKSELQDTLVIVFDCMSLSSDEVAAIVDKLVDIRTEFLDEVTPNDAVASFMPSMCQSFKTAIISLGNEIKEEVQKESSQKQRKRPREPEPHKPEPRAPAPREHEPCESEPRGHQPCEPELRHIEPTKYLRAIYHHDRRVHTGFCTWKLPRHLPSGLPKSLQFLESIVYQDDAKDPHTDAFEFHDDEFGGVVYDPDNSKKDDSLCTFDCYMRKFFGECCQEEACGLVYMVLVSLPN